MYVGMYVSMIFGFVCLFLFCLFLCLFVLFVFPFPLCVQFLGINYASALFIILYIWILLPNLSTTDDELLNVNPWISSFAYC